MRLGLARAMVASGLALTILIVSVAGLRAQDGKPQPDASPPALAKGLIGTWVLAGTPEKEVEPPAKRESRQNLIRIANLYFEGLEQRTGDIVPFSDACVRFENGTQTAGAPLPGTPPRPPIKLPDGRAFSMPTGCKAGFNTKMFSYISRIDHRRYPIVDRSRGVVMSFVTFQHEGNVKSAEVPGVGEVPMFASALHPFAVVIAETFEIKSGKIHEIEADMTKLPYGAGTGWTP